MSTKSEMDAFLADKRIAFAGVSRNSSKISNQIYKKLKETGYKVYPINPNAQLINGDKCYADIRSLPEPVLNLMIVAGPYVAVQVLQEAIDSPIKRIWIQTGPGKLAGLATEIEQAQEAGKTVISGHCPFMYIEPVTLPHNIHRFFTRLVGKYPK